MPLPTGLSKQALGTVTGENNIELSCPNCGAEMDMAEADCTGEHFVCPSCNQHYLYINGELAEWQKK